MIRKWWVLASVACGTFMATLDSSIVNIALPTLTQELHTDLFQVKWVIIAYLLVITCLLLPFGRLSDLYGRKRVFLAGFVVFVLGSALCAFAPALNWLVFFRVVQALGASMLMANGPAIITANFPARERGMALGTLAMVVSAGLLSGPSIGGILISKFGWPTIFMVNVPVGILGIFLVHRFIRPEPRVKVGAPFDWAGAFLQTVVLLLFIVLFDPPNISISGSVPLTMPRWLLGILVLVVGGIFVKIESEAEAPLFDLSLLKDRTFWTANLAGFLTFVSYSAVTVLMPFFLEEVVHFPPHKAGIFMTAIPLTILVVAPMSGRLSDRLGSQELSFAGAAVGALALFAMAGVFGGGGLMEHTEAPKLLVALSLVGLAIGLFQSPNNNAIMGAVPTAKLGVASALLATVRNLGLVTGTGLSTALFTWRRAVTSDFISAFHFTLFISALVGIGAAIAALGKKRGPNIYHEKHVHGMEA